MKPWTSPKEEESAIDTFIQSLPNEEMVLITYKESRELFKKLTLDYEPAISWNEFKEKHQSLINQIKEGRK